MQLARFSLGVGDRFAQQGKAQLRACVLAADQGVTVAPVWNKSNREHLIVGSEPMSVREAADEAVRELGWRAPYHVDADHIGIRTVDRFLVASDFFTLDVADSIGVPAGEANRAEFVARHPEFNKPIEVAGLDEPVAMTREIAARISSKYLHAVEEAGRIYRHIESAKGRGKFITEVSMDETDDPQSPAELLVILAAIADEKVPIETIAPKFSGRFNKGVDYVGNVEQFEREFESDVAVVAHARAGYGLPENLKLSVHSGSDKFSIYAPMRRALRKFDMGIHLKTAGTTWLEELIGLAEAGGEGLKLAREIYAEAIEHRDDLCAPYAAVIDISPERLPAPASVARWSAEQFTGALRHDRSNPLYNPDLRQLLHVGYKIAAHYGHRYLDLVRSFEKEVARNVTANLYDRHIVPLFLER
jgi:hypothetical protein